MQLARDPQITQPQRNRVLSSKTTLDRVTIEYDLPRWDQASLGLQGLREREEEQRWITSEVVLGLASGTVKVELTDAP
jgi:hypothetical protein